MKKMPMLFDIPVTKTDEEKATEYLSKLQKMNFVGVNMIYLTNYIDGDLSIALGHIKDGYKRYVLSGNWSEQKFTDIVLVIARERKMMIPVVFLQYGMKYDEGKLSREINLEKKKYNGYTETTAKKEKKASVSKEEQELLDYIAKNGGL